MSTDDDFQNRLNAQVAKPSVESTTEKDPDSTQEPDKPKEDEAELQQQQQQAPRRPANLFDLLYGVTKLAAYDIPKGVGGALGNAGSALAKRTQKKALTQYTEHVTKLKTSVGEFESQLNSFKSNSDFKRMNDAISSGMQSPDLAKINDIALRKKAAIERYESTLKKKSSPEAWQKYEKTKSDYNNQIDLIDAKRKIVETAILETPNYTQGLKNNDIFHEMHRNDPSKLANHASDLENVVDRYEASVLKPSMELKSTKNMDREKQLEETKDDLLTKMKEAMDKMRENILAIVAAIKSVFGR